VEAVAGKSIVSTGYIEYSDFALTHLEDFVSARGHIVNTGDDIFGPH
jgi:hypothetical protein